MKISIDIDCTPLEARRFLGLPDVEAMQKAMMDQLQERMMSALASTDPEMLMKTWLPAGLAGFEQLQKMFWAAAEGAASGNAGGGRTRKG
jgi:hypothetical protein